LLYVQYTSLLRRRRSSNFWGQFHQRETYEFFVRMYVSAAFSKYMQLEKTTFVRKICTFHVDEIDTCLPHKQFFCPFLLPEETFASFSSNLLSRGTDWKTKNRQAHFSNKACWKINTIPVKIFLFFRMNHFSLNDVNRIK